MSGIDCPERRQDHYQAAKNALAGYIFRKKVIIRSSGRDRNRRILATVFTDSRNINALMVTNGYAWHYKKYSADAVLAAAEVNARAARKGLWKSGNPVPPWEFRASRSGKNKRPATRIVRAL